ncbi:MAG: hypothetical protein AAF378_09875 [Cyanobacteria bacterium P01_A01_bin.84]
MNNKFLGIIAASVTAIGSTIISAPANAVEQNVNIDINIQPTMYLRTFQNVSLQITQGDLGAQDKDFDPTNNTTNGTTAIDQARPTLGAGNQTQVTKNVQELFAVWGTGDAVNVTVTATQDTLTHTDGVSTAEISTITANGNSSGTPSATVPIVGGADITFDLTNATNPGQYSGGILKVEALAQL